MKDHAKLLRNIVFAAIIGSALVFTACDTELLPWFEPEYEYEYEYDWTFINETDYDIFIICKDLNPSEIPLLRRDSHNNKKYRKETATSIRPEIDLKHIQWSAPYFKEDVVDSKIKMEQAGTRRIKWVSTEVGVGINT